MYNIVINATAARESGALTVIKDFVNFINILDGQDYNFYLFTCTKNVFQQKNNLKVFELPVQNWRSRIKWDSKEFERTLIQYNIKMDLVFSFQNTCSKFKTKQFKNIPQLVYYHQPLPLIKYKWNPLKKNELKLFLYSKFYSFFVNKNNKNATYIVQLVYIKKLFCERFRNINRDNIFVIRPNIPNINISNINIDNSIKNKNIMIYPAANINYKNHIIIVKAIAELIRNKPELKKSIYVYFTLDSNAPINKLIDKYELQNNIICIGSLPWQKLMEIYKSAKALLFPSKIETFGLPLTEAAMFGLPIIAADLPYAKEVLMNYTNSVFCNPDSVEQWKVAIEDCLINSSNKDGLKQNSENSWEDVLKIINKILN